MIQINASVPTSVVELESAMTEVEAATYWLGWIKAGKNIGAFLVAIGVAAEFSPAKPYEDKIENSRKEELASLHAESDKARAAAAEAAARAAEANRLAENERLARVKIEAGLASRRLTDEQITKLASAFSKIKGQLSPIKFGRLGDKEAHDFATDILKAADASGIAIELSEIGAQSPPRHGLKIYDGLLKVAFDSAGIKVDEVIPNTNAILMIFVGLKPPPF
jgi:hypothetical protein